MGTNQVSFEGGECVAAKTVKVDSVCHVASAAVFRKLQIACGCNQDKSSTGSKSIASHYNAVTRTLRRRLNFYEGLRVQNRVKWLDGDGKVKSCR